MVNPTLKNKLKLKYTQIFLENKFVNAVSGKTFADVTPVDCTKIADVQAGEKADVDRAVRAARNAFAPHSEWRQLTPSERGQLLYKLAELLERDVDYLATLESADIGKPYRDAVGDVKLGAKFLRYFAGLSDKLNGQSLPIDGHCLAYTRWEPIGVCGAILPWNFPLMLLCWKVGPALCAGCTLVIKPAEQSPLSALHFASLVVEAGIPAGVINIVPGFGPSAGSALAHHMDVDMISFTGSTAVGKMIMKAAADSNLKKVTLLLSGKSPNVVFNDADIDQAVEMSHFALFHNMGQCCTAGSRCYVQEQVYDEFVRKATHRAQQKKVGDPFDPTVESGPQVDRQQVDRIVELIESGQRQGARLMCGGKRLYDDSGCYLQPTVFADVTDEMRIAKEEIFGPVMQIMKFKTMDEVIARANSSVYGLASSIFTKNIDRAIEYANAVQAGTVWVNCYHVVTPQAPFGGYKQSGIGREHAIEGVREYCQLKTVIVKSSTAFAS